MKKWLMAGFLSVLFLVAGALWGYGLYLKNNEVDKVNTARQSLVENQENQRNKLLLELVDVTDVEKHPDPQERVERLEALGPLIGDSNSQYELALSIAYYEVAEDRLYQAQNLASHYTKETASDMNPLVMENFYSAIANYKKAKERIDTIKETEGDDDFNFHLQYARGNIYFRALAVLASNDEKMELFNQTALSWERALDFRSKDQDTQANLEFLKNNQSSLLAGATGDDLKKLKQMPKLSKPRYSINSHQGTF